MAAFFFDMAKDERPDIYTPDNVRFSVALASQRLVLLEDIVDTRIDEDQVQERLEEKMAFLRSGVDFLIGDAQEQPSEKVDLRYRAAFTLASIIRESFASTSLVRLEDPMRELANAVGQQLICKDPEQLMKLTHSIGAGCIEGCAIFVEILTEKELQPIRLAARSIGAYGQLLDHATEIDEDLDQEHNNTFATLTIRSQGDCPEVRQAIKERYHDEASDTYRQGAEVLTKRQLKRFNVLRNLIDAKFKFVDRLKRLRK